MYNLEKICDTAIGNVQICIGDTEFQVWDGSIIRMMDGENCYNHLTCFLETMQKHSKNTFTQLIAELKKEGIDIRDIKTHIKIEDLYSYVYMATENISWDDGPDLPDFENIKHYSRGIKRMVKEEMFNRRWYVFDDFYLHCMGDIRQILHGEIDKCKTLDDLGKALNKSRRRIQKAEEKAYNLRVKTVIEEIIDEKLEEKSMEDSP